LQSLEDLRESVAESYRSYGKSYVKQYKAYFEEIEKNIYPVLNRLEEIFPNQKHNLLDIGSGPGEDLAFFQTLDNIKAVGLEPSEIFIDMCNKKEKDGYLLESSIFQGYAENMPFKDSEFHIVYAQRSLLHVPYVFHTAIGADKFFKESARVLKKKGLFYLTLREGDSGYIQKSTGRFFQGYNEEMIQSLADKNNFEILYFNKVTNERFPVGHWQKWLTVLLQLK
jgi:ubiquinone/menaquinone biosynthesis C-methylase UbiE